MRLSKPLIPTSNPVLCEREDIMSDVMLPPIIQMGNNDTVGGSIEALGIGALQPNSTLDLDIEMFPLKPGMQQIVGLAIKLLEPTLTETSSSNLASSVNNNTNQPPKNLYELGVLADVFVENNV
eukprot:gene8439-9926_t